VGFLRTTLSQSTLVEAEPQRRVGQVRCRAVTRTRDGGVPGKP